MERRKAITTAAAASLTLLAGAAGMTLNSGIVGASGDGKVGQLSPVNTTAKPPITVYVDDPSASTTTVTAAPRVEPTNSPPVTTSAASGYQNGVQHESEDHAEYEGAGDDD